MIQQNRLPPGWLFSATPVPIIVPNSLCTYLHFLQIGTYTGYFRITDTMEKHSWSKASISMIQKCPLCSQLLNQGCPYRFQGDKESWGWFPTPNPNQAKSQHIKEGTPLASRQTGRPGGLMSFAKKIKNTKSKWKWDIIKRVPFIQLGRQVVY